MSELVYNERIGATNKNIKKKNGVVKENELVP